jgi:hypothetical protein
MRRWWKSLGLLAGGLVSLGGIAPSASAQFPPAGPGGFGMPPGGGMMGPPSGMGILPAAGMTGPPPGAFGGNPNLGGRPAEFPNPAQPSQEPAAPFSIRDDGMPNAFTELIDPRPRMHQPQMMVFRGEPLRWWIPHGPNAAVLVTTSTTGLATGETGALGEPHTVALVSPGDNTVNYGWSTGFRLSMGLALNGLPPIDVSGFSFNRNVLVFAAGSTNATGQLLGRPVQLSNISTSTISGTEAVEFVNIPGIAAGTVTIRSRLSLWGIDANGLFNCAEADRIKIDLLLGYRHTDLYEAFEIQNSLVGIKGNVNFGGKTFPTGFSTSVIDSFKARNAFDGGQFGFRTTFGLVERLMLFSDLKFAMGITNQALTIGGTSTVNAAVANRPSGTLQGGILALASNSGQQSRSEFSIIPEANLGLSCQLNSWWRIFGGYNILYWSSIIRPGDHINNVVDSRQIPTDQDFNPSVRPGTPGFPSFVTRSFTVHGFFVGMEFGF